MIHLEINPALSWSFNRMLLHMMNDAGEYDESIIVYDSMLALDIRRACVEESIKTSFGAQAISYNNGNRIVIGTSGVSHVFSFVQINELDSIYGTISLEYGNAAIYCDDSVVVSFNEHEINLLDKLSDIQNVEVYVHVSVESDQHLIELLVDSCDGKYDYVYDELDEAVPADQSVCSKCLLESGANALNVDFKGVSPYRNEVRYCAHGVCRKRCDQEWRNFRMPDENCGNEFLADSGCRYYETHFVINCNKNAL